MKFVSPLLVYLLWSCCCLLNRYAFEHEAWGKGIYQINGLRKPATILITVTVSQVSVVSANDLNYKNVLG